MSSCISESAVQLEARRRVAEESAVARAAALEAQTKREAEKIRLIEAQREDRIRRDAEQIQARLRAEEAEREARRIAEQEAFEQAVAEQVAALKKRPLEERMLAEVEELRHVVSTLSSQLSSTLKTPPPSYGLDNLQSKVASLSASPWNSGIEQVKAQLTQISSQISAQNSQLADIRSLATKPARSVSIFASAMVLGPMNNTNQGASVMGGLPNSPSGVRMLLVTYHLIHQTATAASGAQNFLDVQENQVGTIAVPAGQRVYIVSALWKPNNNVRGGQTLMDVTGHLKATGIENQ
jgi:hypothetical protein